MISLIIPVRDEPGINEFLRSLTAELDHLEESCEIIIVMGDKEYLFVKPMQPRNSILIKSYGDSLERSILLGFSTSSGNKIIVMDGDGSHEAKTVPLIASKLEDYEMVVGSRFNTGSIFYQSGGRKAISRFFKIMAKLKGTKLSDPMSGFFGIRKSVLDRVKFKPFKWKTCLEIELKANPSVYEVPIYFRERRVGISKSTLIIGLNLIWDIITL